MTQSEFLKREFIRILMPILLSIIALAAVAAVTTVESHAADQNFKVTASEGLSLRSSTSTSSKRLSVVPYNKTVLITDYKTANGYDWGKTTYGGKTGWVAMKYVKPYTVINSGKYMLVPKCAPNLCLDVASRSTANWANVQIWSKTADAGNQIITPVYLGNGFYKLVFQHSGKVLNVANGGTANGTNVQQYYYDGTPASQWQIVDGGSGYYIIINRASGKALDVTNFGNTNGSNVAIHQRNGSTAQRWKFETPKTSDVVSDSSSASSYVYNIAHQCIGSNYKQYGSSSYESWCGYYARWVLNQAYLKAGYSTSKARSLFPYSASLNAVALPNAYMKSSSYGKYYSYSKWRSSTQPGISAKQNATNSTYTPKPGDLIVVETDGVPSNGPDHIGIIIKVNKDGSFVTSEGNTGAGTTATRKVKEHTYVKCSQNWAHGSTWCRSNASGVFVHGICSVK